MKKNIWLIFLLCLLLTASCKNGNDYDRNASVTFVTRAEEKKVDIMINGKFFTSFCWPENVYKPILFPVLTSAGTEITRGFPLKPREGETVDHLHQVGIWFTYGNVNGLDFWGNGNRGFKEPGGGEIKHLRIERVESRNGEGILVSSEDWLDPHGKTVLHEKTEYHFLADGPVRLIDRITTLTAGDTAVLFKDTKEGMLGIRVARQLEMPSKTPVILTDSTGKPSSLKDSLNTDVTGKYLSTEGLEGDAVWGTRARWMILSGNILNEKISVAICDHPKNPGFPTYWHARGYGLFAANPLGWYDFSKSKEVFNFTIPAKESVRFRYRIIINSGQHLGENDVQRYFNDFSTKYKR